METTADAQAGSEYHSRPETMFWPGRALKGGRCTNRLILPPSSAKKTFAHVPYEASIPLLAFRLALPVIGAVCEVVVLPIVCHDARSVAPEYQTVVGLVWMYL